jgi:acylglycerol lipase
VTATLDLTPARLPVSQWRDVIHMEPSVQVAAAGWIPERPKAIALLSHGHAEHLGRYSHVVSSLADDGFAIYGIDHRGHGRSTGTRALVASFDQAVQDLYVLALHTQQRHPGLPIVLIGHSMGGLIALRYALRHQRMLTALVTSGPALIIDAAIPSPLVTAGKLASRVAPKAQLPRSRPELCELSRAPIVRQHLDIDHRVWRGQPRLRTAATMLAAGEETRHRLGEITLPLLAMHGAEDRVTSARGTELMRDRVASEDKTVILWEKMRHEIFNAPERAKVIGMMRSWLADRFR